jgi:hypothetical protein
VRTGILACFAALLLAAPAGAVVGGTPQDPAAVPWYAAVGSCGGTLVLPDHVMTAEHCVRDRALDQLGVGVAGQVRAARGVTFAPGWRHRNGADNVYDDEQRRLQGGRQAAHVHGPQARPRPLDPVPRRAQQRRRTGARAVPR